MSGWVDRSVVNNAIYILNDRRGMCLNIFVWFIEPFNIGRNDRTLIEYLSVLYLCTYGVSLKSVRNTLCDPLVNLSTI